MNRAATAKLSSGSRLEKTRLLLRHFANLEAREPPHLQAGALEQLADRLGVVLDERLLDQDVVGKPRPELAFENLLENLRRLARVLRVAGELGLGDLGLLRDLLRRDVLAAARHRSASRNVH